MKIKKILISQPQPTNGSPYTELSTKFNIQVDFFPFFKVEPISAKEFRLQKINILDHTAIVFSSRTTIDAFFNLCEELRIAIPETMKYFCVSEAIANYLQKYIVFRKRKIFFGNGTITSLTEVIGAKHKNENFLLTVADNCKSDLNKLFTKCKYKHSSAILVSTVFSNLTSVGLEKYDMVVFYSPSDIRSLIENFPDFQQNGIEFATFGPATLKALKAHKLNANIIAPTPEAPSISKAILDYLEKSK